MLTPKPQLSHFGTRYLVGLNPLAIVPEEALRTHSQASEVTMETLLALACTSTLAFGLTV